MKRFSSYLGLAVAFVVLWLTMSFTGSPPALAQGMKPFLFRDVDAAALRPFQAEFCNENGIGGCGSILSSLTVPTATGSGEPVRRLVIEYVSGRCTLSGSGGIVASLGLDTTANGVFARHRFTPVATQAGFDVVAGQVTRLYADPGSQVEFITAVFSAPHQCRLTLSGHLVIE